jgi:hypothetical protein
MTEYYFDPKKQEEADKAMDAAGAKNYLWHSDDVFGPIGGDQYTNAAARKFCSDTLDKLERLKELCRLSVEHPSGFFGYYVTPFQNVLDFLETGQEWHIHGANKDSKKDVK